MVAVVFNHRIGSSLNEQTDFHVCAVDGVFEKVPGGLWATQKRGFACVSKRDNAARCHAAECGCLVSTRRRREVTEWKACCAHRLHKS